MSPSELCTVRPALAVRRNGTAFKDREGVAWCDPFLTDVHDYNVDLAVAAAGYTRLRITHLTGGNLAKKRFRSRSKQRRILAPMDGCFGIHATSIRLRWSRARLPKLIRKIPNSKGQTCAAKS